MNHDEAVSVVMPVRDEEDFVASAVRALLRQTRPPDEILIVDGRSRDATRCVVTEIATRDPRIRLLDNPRRIIPAALNVGLADVRGTFVLRVDGHATVSADYIEQGLAVLAARPDVAGVGGRRLGVADTPTGRAVALALESPAGVGDSINHYGLRRVDTDHASFGLYRVAAARAVGGWDESLPANEDVDFDHRLQAAGWGLVYEPAMEIHWQVRESVRHLARQYRRYGRGKGAMVRKNGPSAVRPRHLAPPALLAVLAGAVVMTVLGRHRAAAGLIAPYVTVIGFGSLDAWRRRGSAPTAPHALPLSLVAMHVSWGWGFLEGIAGRLAAPGSVVAARGPRRRHRTRVRR